jgi:hypothetical protein
MMGRWLGELSHVYNNGDFDGDGGSDDGMCIPKEPRCAELGEAKVNGPIA